MRRAMTTMLLAACLAAACVAPAAGADGLGDLIAPAGACPGQSSASASLSAQAHTMLCMTNYARRQRGLRPMRDSSELDRSAGRKSGDMIRCDEFSHEACHRQFTYWMKQVGFIEEPTCWRAGENIAWGSGRLGSAHSIFAAWINSEGHRENILGPYGQIGIGLRVGTLEGFNGARVWTQHFGARC
jgi:uncharacterized protein YkwD